jgi:protein-tyrosine phosphatase
MNLLYKAYCFTNTLVTKSLNYVIEKKTPIDYIKTQRMNQEKVSIMNSLYHLTFPMTQITTRLYLGNAYNARDFYELKKANIGLIVNCTTEFPNYFPEEFDYVQVPVQDIPNESLTSYFPTVTQKIHEFLKEHPTKNVFIHCFMGASRSVSFLIAYLMRYTNMTVDESIEKIESLRPFINLNVDFYFQLVEYHLALNTEPSLYIVDEEKHSDNTNQPE